MVNGVGRHQSNSGSDVAGTGSDKNNNVRRSYANLNTIPEAVSALSKEVDAINTIKRLTLQLELKDQAVNDLREKVRNFVGISRSHVPFSFFLPTPNAKPENSL